MADNTASRASPSGPLLVDWKLRAPPLREGMITRPHLVELLNAGAGRKLTLLSAPTGFGKTTLLAQWFASEEDNWPFAWVTLDVGDKDPVELPSYKGKGAAR